jgi:hypothetical protein
MAIMEPNDEEKQEQLPNDYSTPFSPPSGIQDTTDDTHPDADTDLDEQERYDAGISAASGADDPGSRGVLGYSPPAGNDDDDDKEEE